MEGTECPGSSVPCTSSGKVRVTSASPGCWIHCCAGLRACRAQVGPEGSRHVCSLPGALPWMTTGPRATGPAGRSPLGAGGWQDRAERRTIVLGSGHGPRVGFQGSSPQMLQEH